MTSATTISSILFLLRFPLFSGADLLLYGLSPAVYAEPRDINIGVILSNTLEIPGKACYETQIPGSWGIEYPEAVAFAVHQININPTILSNISLGFYILDDCSSTAMALAQGLKFVHRNNDSLEENCLAATASPRSFYDVIGVVAPMTSSATVSLSYLYSAAKIPLVGYITSSDELSDKSLHPMFNRVIGPDKFQAQAILEFISRMGWSYISVVYSLGPYGERAFDTIKATAAVLRICIAVSHRVNDWDDTDPVARSLLNVPRARVVILFAEEIPVKHLLVSVEKFNGRGRFIWIVSDSFSIASKESIAQHKEVLRGAFTFFFNASLVPQFYEYIERLNPETSSNPWMRPAWENLTGCSFRRGTCDPKADILRQPLFEFMLTPALLMDAVNTLAYSVQDLIKDVCLSVNVSSIAECVRAHDLNAYIRNVNFHGYTGKIKFNRNGDALGKYIISQLVYDILDTPLGYGDPNSSKGYGLVAKHVATYDRYTEQISFTGREIMWDHLIDQERLVPLRLSENDSGIPESVCSRPCVAGEYKIQKQLECCWECRICRDNERISDNRTSCQPCKIFTWPDPETDFTSCSPIPLWFPPMSSTLSVLQICFAFLAIAATLIVCAAYCAYHESRVIKAASRELSVIQLGAILLGYLTVITFQVEPSDHVCGMVYFLFCLSFDSLYAPLLVKSVRIYRIFLSGSTNTKSLRFTSPMSQLIITFLIILVQVAICVVTYILYYPTARRTQPVTTDKFVELTCDMTLPGLASFLAYNLVLVSLCSVFAFKTRQLPDNFNESRFISMCVSTTLVIWLAFIPTYFTAGREFVRVLLLSVALLLNHTVALVFLFFPKIFAVVYLPDESRFQSRVHPTLANTLSTAKNSSNA